MADTKVKVDVEFKSIQELQKALKSAKDEMAGLEAGTKAFNQAANRAGELKHKLDEINQSVRGASSDFGDMLGNVAKAGAGITGAFQAAKGAMSLFGAESEDVTKAIEKMQSIMAMTQGLAAIDNGIKGFIKFTTAVTSGSGKIKKALIGTGLGALTVVIGSIIANWKEFSKEIGLSEKQMQKFGNVVAGVMNVLKGSLKSVSSALIKIVKRDFKGAWNEVKEGFDFAALYAEGVINHISEVQVATVRKTMEKRWEAYYEELQREEDAELARSIANKNADWDNGPTKKSIAKYILPDEKEDEDIDKWIKKRLDAITEANNIIGTTFLEGLDAQQEALDKSYQEGLISEQKYNQASNALAKQRANYHVQYATQAMQSISSIFSSLADIEDGQTEESFKKQKAFQISAAVMNMLGGITAAIASCWSPTNAWQTSPGQAAMAALSAASVLASGIAQIAQIKRQTFNDSSTTSASTASLSSAATSLAAPVQYTQDVQGAEITSAIKDTKVYVTEYDITKTQNRVSVAESEARF